MWHQKQPQQPTVITIHIFVLCEQKTRQQENIFSQEGKMQLYLWVGCGCTHSTVRTKEGTPSTAPEGLITNEEMIGDLKLKNGHIYIMAHIFIMAYLLHGAYIFIYYGTCFYLFLVINWNDCIYHVSNLNSQLSSRWNNQSFNWIKNLFLWFRFAFLCRVFTFIFFFGWTAILSSIKLLYFFH